MTNRLQRLFTKGAPSEEPEALGEDMAPSPSALAERSALSVKTAKDDTQSAPGPFSSVAAAPMRDFTG